MVQNKIYQDNSEWYNINNIMGYNNKAHTFILIGARERGKSYSVMKMFLKAYRYKGIPFYWIRLADNAVKNLLSNNAQQLFDADLRRKYHLYDIEVKRNCVYEVTKRGKKGKDGSPGKVLEKQLICQVFSLSTAYSQKGQALYDPDYIKDHPYHICFDEMNKEQGEKKTVDVAKAFKNMLENIMRSTPPWNAEYNRPNAKIVCIGNYCDAAMDILSLFNFQPVSGNYGVYYLHKRHTVIDYIPNSEQYEKRRNKSILNDYDDGNDSNYKNSVSIAQEDINTNHHNQHADYNIQFNDTAIFTVWDGKYIDYANEHTLRLNIPTYPMTTSLLNARGPYVLDVKNNILKMYDIQYYSYCNENVKIAFNKHVKLLRPNKI